MNAQKTPVSILTEMMVKKGSGAPNWELVHDGGGTHLNHFIYEVTCDGFSARGEGRNKKDAKHEAATNMLELIASRSRLPQLPATPELSPIKTLSKEPLICPKSPINAPFRNAVGELKDLCGMHNLGDPQYKEVADIGPAHARVFTIQCSVSTFNEEGTALTKKQAKHEAARQMIDRINKHLKPLEKENPIVKQVKRKQEEEESEDEETQESQRNALSKYPDLTKLHLNEPTTYKVNLGLKIKDYHKNLRELFISNEHVCTFLEELKSVKAALELFTVREYDDELFAEVKEGFQKVLEPEDIRVYEDNFDSKRADHKIVCIRVNTAPDICEIGDGKTDKQAYAVALRKVIESMEFFLQDNSDQCYEYDCNDYTDNIKKNSFMGTEVNGRLVLE